MTNIIKKLEHLAKIENHLIMSKMLVDAPNIISDDKAEHPRKHEEALQSLKEIKLVLMEQHINETETERAKAANARR